MKAERHGVLGYQLFLVSNYVGRAVNHLCVDPKRKLQVEAVVVVALAKLPLPKQTTISADKIKQQSCESSV